MNYCPAGTQVNGNTCKPCGPNEYCPYPPMYTGISSTPMACPVGYICNNNLPPSLCQIRYKCDSVTSSVLCSDNEFSLFGSASCQDVKFFQSYYEKDKTPYLKAVEPGRYYNIDLNDPDDPTNSHITEMPEKKCNKTKYCVYGEVRNPPAGYDTNIFFNKEGLFYYPQCEWQKACLPKVSIIFNYEVKNCASFSIYKRFSASGNQPCFTCENGKECLALNQYFPYVGDLTRDQLTCSEGTYAWYYQLTCRAYLYLPVHPPFGLYKVKSNNPVADTDPEIKYTYAYHNLHGDNPLLKGQQLCMRGTYTIKGFPYCIISYPGFLMPPQNTDLYTSANQCPQGYFCAVDFDHVTSSYGLKTAKCPLGTYALPFTGSFSQEVNCAPCPVGNYCPGDSTAKKCPVGYICETGTINELITCPAGLYYDDTVTPTPADDTGKYSHCKQCPMGFYCLHDVSAPIKSEMKPCMGGYLCGIETSNPYAYPSNPGFHIPQGSTTETICPQNSYCPEGSKDPIPCPGGKKTDSTGKHSISDCIACKAGTICDTTIGGASDASCPANHYCPSGVTIERKCPPGTFGSGATGFKSEIECPACSLGSSCYYNSVTCEAGYYCAFNTYFPHETPCPDGTFGAGLGLTDRGACTNCVNNEYCLEGSTARGTCPQGYLCDGKKKTPCAAGTANDHGASSCKFCVIGTICPEGYQEINPIVCSEGSYMDTASSSGPCKICEEGYFCTIGIKKPCGLGKWSGRGQNTCSNCPAGFSCSSTASKTPCPAGSYCADNSIVIYPCDFGYYCPQGSAFQLKCPPGTYSTGGTATCTKVDAGGYSEAMSSVKVGVDCKLGFYCESGSKKESDKLCPPGTHSGSRTASKGDCSPCSLGYYCPGGTSSTPNSNTPGDNGELICPQGHYCPVGSAMPTKCPIGTFQGLTGKEVIDDCELCMPGKTCTQRGLTAPDGNCDPGYYCHKGAYVSQPIDYDPITNIGTGNICTIGHYCIQGSDKPEPCPIGKFNVFIGSKSLNECLDCPFGFICQTNEGAYADCPIGVYCPVGTSAPSNLPLPGYHDVKGQGDQIPCMKGNFTNVKGESECKPCTAGYLCRDPASGSTSFPLIACPIGSYCPIGSVNEKACPEGTYRDTTGAASIDKCLSCTAGKYCKTYKLTSPSGDCAAGFFCIEGAFSDKPAYVGFTSTTPTNTIFGPCPIGFYCPQGTSTPIPCPKGSYAPGFMTKASTDCTPCPPGKFCAIDGLSAPSGVCSAGSYCPIGSQVSTEMPCTQGHYCPQEQATELKCEAGSYQTAGGQSTCDPCPTKFYCDAGSISAGLPCPQGYYCPPSTGYYMTNPCPPGTYDSAGSLATSSDCTPCPDGFYCKGYGQTATSGQCEIGYYCLTGAKATSPTPTVSSQGGQCEAGFYCPLGTNVQVPCDPGKVCSAEALSAPNGFCNDGFKCGAGLKYTNPFDIFTTDTGLCDAGHWCQGGLRTPCGTGTYLPSKGAGVIGITECLTCPYGSFCAGSGLAAPDNTCPSGYYCGSGQTLGTVNQCPQGFKCPSGSIQKIQCPPGYYQKDPMKDYCDACSVSNYCLYDSTAGTIAEIKCETGMTCPDSAMDHAVPCPVGQYQSALGQLSCLNCDAQYYCDHEGLDHQLDCPAGYFCTAGQDSARQNLCDPGYYCPQNSLAKQICTPGFYCSDYGLAAVSGPCEPGYICYQGATVPNPSGVTGHMCSAGHYCPDGASETPCPIGTYNQFKGSSTLNECKSCPSGKICKDTGLTYPVNPKDNCPADYYCTITTSGPIKTPCDIGYMCPEAIADQILCLPGTYQDTQGKSTCLDCPPGSYCDFDGSGITVKKPCPQGYYCPQNTGNYESFPCPAGTFNPTTGMTSIGDCTSCTQEHYCINQGLTVESGFCENGYLCPTGSKVPIDSNKLCPKNKFCIQGIATDCGPSTYTYGTVTGAIANTDCMKCLPGKLCPNHDVGIQPCTAGNFCNDGSTIICPTGAYCPAEVSVPISCPLGTYSPTTGATSCTLCDNGFYCNIVGMSTQTICSDNMICLKDPVLGSIEPQPCTYGAMKTVSSNACEPCAAGKWCWPTPGGTPGQTNVRGDCKDGFVCRSGSFTPTPYYVVTVPSPEHPVIDDYNGKAARGHYTKSTAPNNVAKNTPCAVGTYMPSMGATECLPCPPGYYCDTTGIYDISAKLCSAGYVCTGGSTGPTTSGSVNVNACSVDHYCPQGTVFDVICQEGYMATSIAMSACVPCDVGFSCSALNTGASTHKACASNNAACLTGTGVEPLCPPGKYLSGAACVDCPAGLFCVDGKSESSAAGCGTTAANHGQCCTAGYICLGGSRTSKPLSGTGHICEIGFYCPEGTTNQESCDPNKYIFDIGKIQKSDCTDCMEGFICTVGSSNYDPCPQGQYCPTGITGSLPCPKGTYSNKLKLKIVHDCESCPAGFLCDTLGSVTYNGYDCPKGQYCFLRAIEGIECPYGTFNEATGGRSVKSCKPCPQGYYCPELGQTDGKLYQCDPGNMCEEGAANPSICPGGYYCDYANQIYKLICPVNFYCPPGSDTPIACTLGETCPEGSSFPIKCVPGQVSTNTNSILKCTPCPPGTYSDSGLNSVCEICEPGYVCLGETNVKYPWSEKFHRGYRCPAGAYCPMGSSKPNYCPAGAYNPHIGSFAPIACLLCEASTFNPIEGQPSCRGCGDSASSEEGAAMCECKGKNRAFLVSDSSCRCKPGYQFLENSEVKTDTNSKIDCQPIIYPRCPQKQSRSYQGNCTDTTDCTTACNGGEGVRSPTLGICQCKDTQKLNKICNKGCRDSMPVMTITPDSMIRINDAKDPYNYNPEIIDPRDLPNFNLDYMTCPEGSECKSKSVHFTNAGKIGASYGLSPRLASAYQNALNTARRLEERLGFSKPDRRLLASHSSDEISNPVMCIHQGDSVVFELDDSGHYPIYQKDSLLNSNQNFDYAPFKILAEQITAQVANGENKAQYFAYTFTESGRYFFTDSIDAEQTVIIYVTKTSEECPSENAYLQPRTTGALSIFGLALNESIVLEPDYVLMAIIIISFVFTLAMLLILMKWVSEHIWKPKDAINPLFREGQKDFDVKALTLDNGAELPKDINSLGIFKDVERVGPESLFVPDLIEGINTQKLEELDPFIIDKILKDYQDYKDYLQQQLLKGCEQQSKDIEALNSDIEKIKFMLNERYEKLIGLLKLDVDYTKLTDVKIKAEEEKDEPKKAEKRIKPSDIKLSKNEEKKATEVLRQIMSKKNELNIGGDAYEDNTEKDSEKDSIISEAKSADHKGEDITEKVKRSLESKLEAMGGLSDFEKEKLRDELSSELLNLEYVLAGEREEQEITIRRLLQSRRKKTEKKAPIAVDLGKLTPEEKALKDKIEKEVDEEGRAQEDNIEQVALSKIQRAKDKLLHQLGAPSNLSENEKNTILHNHQEELEQFFESIKQEKDKQMVVLKEKLEKRKQNKAIENIRALREEMNPEIPEDAPQVELIELPKGFEESSEIERIKAEEKRNLAELESVQEQEKKQLENAHQEAYKDKELELEEDLQLEIEKEMEVKKEKTEEKYKLKQQIIEEQRRKIKDQLLFSSGDKELSQKLLEEVKVKDKQLRQLIEQEKKEQDFLLEEKITRRRIAKQKKILNFENRQHYQIVDLKVGQLKKKQEVQGKFELEKIKEIARKAKAKNSSDPSNSEAYKLFEQLWNEKEGVELANMFGRQLAEKESKLRGIYKKNMEQKLVQKKAVKDRYRTLYNDLETQRITSPNQEDYAARLKELRVEEENDLKEMDIKEAMNQKKEEFALRQELEEKVANELGELQDRLAREKIEIIREMFVGQKKEEIELRSKIAEMKDSIDREKDRKIKEIELHKKLILEKYENDMKQRFSSYEDIIKRQREVERLIKEKKGNIAKMVEERKKQIAELKDKAVFTPEQEKELLEKHQQELKELESAMEKERNRQFLVMQEKLEKKQGQRERDQSYNKKKVAFLMGAVNKNVTLAQNERLPISLEPQTELERAIERWRKDMEEREKSQKTTTFQTLQRYLENVGKFRKKGLEGIYLQGPQYQKYLKLMKASKILHKKLEELHRIKANGVLLDLKAALQVFAEDDFDRLKARPERVGGGFRCFDEEGNLLWELYKFIHEQ